MQTDAHYSTVLKETYRVERLLGKGGMGAVYLATHLRLGSKVAVKLLLAGGAGNSDLQHRFRREAKVAMDLSDENIVHIHDYDVTADGTPFIVMEYLEGEDLATLLRREAPLHLDRVVEIAQQIGSALRVAHGEGVVHRDLKPENIFLKRRATGEDVVKVVDFGIAKVLDSESIVTRSGALMGTPLFMAPEQARQRGDIDGRADIFSFGCILYNMLSGRLPFVGKKFAQVLLQIIGEHPPPLRSIVPMLPEEVEAVVERALAKEPAERFQSVDLMMHALSKAAGVSWGTVDEYVETVVTGQPTGFPGADDPMLGYAETLPPRTGAGTRARDSNDELPVTGPGVVPSASMATGPTEAASSFAPGVDAGTQSTTPPSPRPETDPGPIAEVALVPTAPAAHSRLPWIALVAALVVLAGGAGALIIPRTGDAVNPPRAQSSAALAEQKADAATPAASAPDAAPDSAAPDAVAPTPDVSRVKRVRTRKHRRPRPRKPRTPETTTPTGRRGVLKIRVRANGQEVTAPVYVNGRKVGRSPCTARLDPGTHMVRVRWLRYAPVDREVTLAAGERKQVTLDLK